MSKIRNRRYYSGYKKGKWWTAKRRRLYVERNGICENCRKDYSIDSLELHHIIPRSGGGRDIDQNLKLLCSKCHSDQHQETI